MLITICGKDYVSKALPMLRSLLWHRSTAVTLHIIADRPARRRLDQDFEGGWGLPGVAVEYINAEDHVERVETAMPSNFGRLSACSTLRLFAPVPSLPPPPPIFCERSFLR
jgi:hypothetical protein